MPTLFDTLELIKHAHAHQNDSEKGAGVPYYWHLVRVMMRLGQVDEDLLHIALLHDIVEDTNITLDDLRARGYSERVVNGVKWSSKNLFPEMTFANWMRAIGEQAPEDTVLLKISDISDNLGFERMRGLMATRSKPKKDKPRELSLREKVDRKVDKKMRLHGEMGVYDRYYKGWNFMFENTARLPLIEQVFLGDFCHIEQLLGLTTYIPKEEMKNYLTLNRLTSWKVSGELKIIQASNNQDYLAVDIPIEQMQHYEHFLSTQIGLDAIENKHRRDRGHFHVTVLNAMQYGKLKKFNPEGFNNLLKHLGKTFEFFSYGIGLAQKENNQAWFVVCENPELQALRIELNITEKQDFHITLAFEQKDVFGLSKARDSVIYDNSTLWEHFIENSYKKTSKPKL